MAEQISNDAMSVNEFFGAYGVEDKSFFIKEDCKTADGKGTFPALALRDGGLTEDGKNSYAFFVLSRKLEDEGHVLSKQWLQEHKDSIRLYEPSEYEGVTRKYGTIFLSTAESWDDL